MICKALTETTIYWSPEAWPCLGECEDNGRFISRFEETHESVVTLCSLDSEADCRVRGRCMIQSLGGWTMGPAPAIGGEQRKRMAEGARWDK